MTDQKEITFDIDDDGYIKCPVCKRDDAIYVDACTDGGGNSLPGWNVWCETCDVYEITEGAPLQRPLTNDNE